MWFWYYVVQRAIIETTRFWIGDFKQEIPKKLFIAFLSFGFFGLLFGTGAGDLVVEEARVLLGISGAFLVGFVVTAAWKIVTLPPRLVEAQELYRDLEIFPSAAMIAEPKDGKAGRFGLSIDFRNTSETDPVMLTNIALKKYYEDGKTVTELGDIAGTIIKLDAPDFKHLNLEFTLHESLEGLADAELLFTDVLRRVRAVPIGHFLRPK